MQITKVKRRLLDAGEAIIAEESMQTCGVRYAAAGVASSSFTGRKLE
jgi:hypothetical protein